MLQYQQAFKVTYCDRHCWMFDFHGRENICWHRALSVYDLCFEVLQWISTLANTDGASLKQQNFLQSG